MREREIIIGCAATLMLIGLVMVYSNTAVSCGVDPTENEWLVKQSTWVALAALVITVFAHVDYHWLARRSRGIMLLTLGVLAALLLVGPRINGARRWFRLGPLSLQVSEFAKIAVVLYLADFASRKREILRNFWRGLAPPAFVLAATFGLVVAQPDFGTAMLIGTVGAILLVMSGVRWRHVAALAAVAAPAVALLLVAKPYRLQRLIVFLHPGLDPQGAGYHVFQSKITLGSGGWTGVGPGRGLQKLGFLPEAETDFIFAAFGQENGFIGCILLIGVFVALFWAGTRVARAAPDILGRLLAWGVTVLIGCQMIINVGVAASAMPTKGISLPLVSFGGSSILAFAMGIGLLLNVSRHGPGARPRVRGAVQRMRRETNEERP